VFVNLLHTALDAVADVQRARRVELAVRLDATSEMARCWVADNGPGVPLDARRTIFETWFTTKPPSRGTGLGLPIVREIVHGLGGEIAVSGRPGKGARFSFSLPLAR
jgi:C4-dicarboxylate-specific signal transduction histidine kinase